MRTCGFCFLIIKQKSQVLIISSQYLPTSCALKSLKKIKRRNTCLYVQNIIFTGMIWKMNMFLNTMHYALQDTQLMTGRCSHLAQPQLSPLQHGYFSSIMIWALLRRYAEFAAAIVGINETFPHEQMNRLLAVLQEEVTEWNYLLVCSTLFFDGATKLKVESLILRLASKFPGRRDQLLFLINNYDVVRLNWCTVCISHVTLNQEQL